MKKYLRLFITMFLCLAAGMNVSAQFEAGKTYTIANHNDVNAFMQDKDVNVVAVDAMSSTAYWLFEATANTNCYYVKNAVTGLYMQSCSANQVEVALGSTPVEYYIELKSEEGDGMYGMASTDQATYNFTAGTIGANWKATQDTSYGFGAVQGYAAVAGTNHRSFWKIVQQDIPAEPFSIKAGKVYDIRNYSDNNQFLKDRRTGTLLVEDGETNGYGLWTFEPTGNDNCFYMKNVLTGNYIQSTSGNEVEIVMGTTPVEIMVMNDPAKGEQFFGFASTDQANLSFTADQTFGINWKGNGTGQGFAVTLGGRPRSFWKVSEIETVTFADNADNTAAIAATTDAVTTAVSRAMVADAWNTLVVPFDMDADEASRNFGTASIAKFDNETDDGVLHFTTTATIEAGVPYLVKPQYDVVCIVAMNANVKSAQTTAEGTTYDFVGIYAPTTISTDAYYVAPGNTLKKNTAGSSLKAFRAYLQPKSGDAKALTGFDVDGQATGIISVDGNIETGKIYNLNGQQMNGCQQKGIYIVNGKKFVQK